MTHLGAYVAEAFAAIWRNRTRSLLTMLGMIIGTSSIIAVLGISRAASGGITGTLNSFGDQGISISVDPNQDDPQAAALQYRDVRTIQADASTLLDHIEPSYQRNLTLRANGVSDHDLRRLGQRGAQGQPGHARGPAASTRPTWRAARTSACSARSSPTASSRAPRRWARRCRPAATRCTVVGVYAELKGGFFNSIGGNEFLELPYTTFHQIAPGAIDGLNLYAAPGVTVSQASDAIVAVLQRLHGAHAQYSTSDNTAQIQSFNSVLSIIAAGLTGIGGVALVVAGIGIMNIMLVSVTERTREIGLRKAIGAKRGDVALQFLLEAILLSFMGGGIGTALGFVATLLAYSSVEALVGPAPIPYLLIMSVAVGFSTLVGCVFGTYPAIRAARLDPDHGAETA